MADFDGNATLGVKYGLFTLCYEALIAQLDRVERNAGDEADAVLEGVDEIVRGVLSRRNPPPRDLSEAARILCIGLGYLGELKPIARQDLSRISSNVSESAHTWDYRKRVRQFQAFGRQRARAFYSRFPDSKYDGRLTRDARLVFEYGANSSQAPFGYRSDALVQGKPLRSGVITVRFTLQDGFQNYLCYPFFFFHEHLSHVYPRPSDSFSFTDGWLLYAADALLRLAAVRDQALPLRPCQLSAFLLHIFPRLPAHSREEYFKAQDFHQWVDLHAPGRFWPLLVELAFHPERALPSVTGFLHRIYRDRCTEPGRLAEKLLSADVMLDI